jgi:hypothetical protein
MYLSRNDGSFFMLCVFVMSSCLVGFIVLMCVCVCVCVAIRCLILAVILISENGRQVVYKIHYITMNIIRLRRHETSTAPENEIGHFDIVKKEQRNSLNFLK